MWKKKKQFHSLYLALVTFSTGNVWFTGTLATHYMAGHGSRAESVAFAAWNKNEKKETSRFENVSHFCEKLKFRKRPRTIVRIILRRTAFLLSCASLTRPRLSQLAMRRVPTHCIQMRRERETIERKGERKNEQKTNVALKNLWTNVRSSCSMRSRFFATRRFSEHKVFQAGAS